MILEAIVAFAAAAIVTMLLIIWRELHLIGFILYHTSTTTLEEYDNETERDDAR